MSAWNGWYHVNGNTYGTWLRGDARGWRTRHHREHVEGDYKNPPASGTFEETLERSKRLMSKPPVRLSAPQRAVAGRAMVEKLAELGIEVIAASVDAVHFHVLARFRDGEVRPRVARAKKHASHELTKVGLPGQVWAKRSRALPITDRAHQVNTFGYILEHAEKGAWVWSFRQGLYWRKEDGKPSA